MKIAAIISRDLEKGSTKYRLAQYTDFLEKKGVSITYVKRDEVDKKHEVFRTSDLIFNQKCLLKLRTSHRLLARPQPTVFDFDDAIYTRPGASFSFVTQLKVKARFHCWLKAADLVTTPNEFLAGYARRHGARVEVVPMAIDMNIWHPLHESSERPSTVTIGWAGAPVNLHLLEKLDPVLCQLHRMYPSVRFAVFSGRKPVLNCPFEYVPFQPGAEADFVRRLDVGLLPLADEEYSHGKSPIKALQYLASGVPVVGHVLGATAETLDASNSIHVTTEKDWFEALARMIEAPQHARQLGKAGRQRVYRTNSYEVVAEQFYRLLTRSLQKS